ncbi:MAG: isoprenylcysteine carboxylmethyltransferase family protein, partial [archaeon]
FYFVVRFQVGVFNLGFSIWRSILIFLCLLIIIFGTYMNVRGRFYLGKNWSNQIKIYKDHYLVSSGPYKIVRHPLYASLIWIFYACSIIYLNWAAFLLNSFIFVPMMVYRARQEEKLLSEQFKNYRDYKNKTGMFFPKW